jgi:hypothetical protein
VISFMYIKMKNYVIIFYFGQQEVNFADHKQVNV